MFEARAESVNAAAIAVVQEQVCYDTTKLLSDCLVMPPVCFSWIAVGSPATLIGVFNSSSIVILNIWELDVST